jgi:HlyD family secretion protein
LVEMVARPHAALRRRGQGSSCFEEFLRWRRDSSRAQPRRRAALDGYRADMDTVTAAAAPGRTALVTLIDREQRRRKRRLVIWISLAVLVPVASVGLYLLLRPGPVPLEARFRTAAVAHGPLVREVRATGRVDAVASVSVGAEISGRIAQVLVDYNDRVVAGQVMARFDRSALEAQRAQAEAQLAAARAQAAQAALDLAQARRNEQRSQTMFAQGGESPQDHEAAATAAAIAEARLGAAQASVAAQAAAAAVARTNLDHSVIHAPIDGVVITRNIDPGQTVASMLQAPVLFIVAADLRKMEVEAAIDEADIGEVAVGQVGSFTVNAWPGTVFEGRVTEVRNAARVVQDVVTYGAVIAVDNLELKLKPGMTASVRVRTAAAEETDAVPNAALQFTPPGQQRAPASAGVWVLEGQALRLVPVVATLSDGESTAIASGAVPSGAKVLVDLTPEGKQAYGLVHKP